MSELSERLNFNEWVRYCFDRPISDPEWFWEERSDNDWYETSADTVVDYLTRLFEDARRLLIDYSRAQIAQGLRYLANLMCSDYMYVLVDKRVPIAARKRMVFSIAILFEKFFAEHCQGMINRLSRENDSIDDPLNSVCFMWWDTFNIGRPSDLLYFDFIEVMSRTLALKSEACKESALHGLGHEERLCPEVVHRAIDDFLNRETNISPDLRAYALRARAGHIQ